MTSGQLQIRSFDFLWLLATVSIVRTVSTLSTDDNRSLSSLNSLVIQRPRFAGGLLKIPLDVTVQLTQCSMKDIARNIIRFRYGPNGRRLVVRTANASERKQWITALSNCMPTSRAAKSTSSPVYRTFKTVGMSTRISNFTSNYPAIPQDYHHAWSMLDRTSSAGTAVPSLPLYSLDAIKQLAQGYDNLAHQWAEVATETRKFHAEINSLQPCAVSERAAVYCTAY